MTNRFDACKADVPLIMQTYMEIITESYFIALYKKYGWSF